jgi:hypothetical protein
MRLTVAGIACLAVACLGVGSATAAKWKPAFHACVNKQTGAIRLVGARARCRRGEKSITFAQQGKPGTNGQNGAPGQPGTNGQNGTSVVLRPRTGGSTNLTTSPTAVPVTPNQWTQQAGELDVLYVQATVTNSAGCQDQIAPGPPPINFPASASIEIDVNGVMLASVGVFASSASPVTQTVSAPIFDPAAATPQTVTVKAQDNCNTGGHMVLNSVGIDVAAMH